MRSLCLLLLCLCALRLALACRKSRPRGESNSQKIARWRRTTQKYRNACFGWRYHWSYGGSNVFTFGRIGDRQYFAHCCHGWARDSGSRHCTRPICFGSVHYCPNGGSCVRPDRCENCNPTHYSPRCSLCPQVRHCARTHCQESNPHASKRCVQCRHDHGSRGKAYRLYNSSRECKATCSWLPQHNLCFPGTCPGFEDSCTCASGFTNIIGEKNCLHILYQPDLQHGEMTISAQHNGSESKVTVDFHHEENRDVYVNLLPPDGGNIRLNWKVLSSYQPNISDPEDHRKHFILKQETRVGVTRESFVFHMSGDSNLGSSSMGPLLESGISRDSPKVSAKEFRGSHSSFPPPGWQLQSGHTITFTYSAHNGGHVTVRNLDNHQQSKRYFSGQAASVSGKFTFDFSLPYHCSVPEQAGRNCSQQADVHLLLLSDAFTRNNTIAASFGGWRDDHSGVSQYHLEVVPMARVGGELTENHQGPAVGRANFHLANESRDERRDGGRRLFRHEFTVPRDRPSVYSVILTALDSVRNSHKNVRQARRLFIFDASSSISVRNERHPLSVRDCVRSGNLWWLRDLQQQLLLSWRGNFINELHDSAGFLLPAARKPQYQDEYEHTSGHRSIEGVANVLGVVRFSVQLRTDGQGGRSLQQPHAGRWQRVPDLRAQRHAFGLARSDGQSVRLWVRAEDAVGNEKVNSFLLHVDSSPPLIDDLHLVSRGEGGLLVHSSTHLHSMRVEWKATDAHSGVHSVSWQIVDSFNGRVLHSQNEGRRHFDTMKSCQSGSQQPQHCYCTPATGCFNRLFASTPNTKENASTEHNHDLFLKVTVQNNALLSAEKTVKISIDTSAPHPGHVFDGTDPREDVDFQRHRQLSAHWSGFFDPESGVRMYRFGFGSSCLRLEQLTQQTRQTAASWTAPAAGRYFVTVVAFNNAMEPSAAVCSDGVQVVTEAPTVEQLRVSGLRVRPGLVKDEESQEMWYLTERGLRKLLQNDNSSCRSRALPLANVDAFAFARSKFNASVVSTYFGAMCQQIPPAASRLFLTETHALRLSWSAADAVAGIRNYEVLVSHDKSGMSPKFGPVSTQHPEAEIRGANLRDGERVFIRVRAVNRAGIHTDLTLGPLTIDSTPPIFSGRLSVASDSESLRVSWKVGDFKDEVSQPLQFEVAVGRQPHSTDIVDFRPVSEGPGCSHADHVTCASLPLASLDWNLIGSHTYHVSVRCTNQAQLSTVAQAEPLVHSSLPPAAGAVAIEDPDTPRQGLFGEAPSIRFQSRADSVRVRWSGFVLAEEFRVRLLDSRGGEVKEAALKATATRHQFEGLRLQHLQEYHVVVEALNPVGRSSASSSSVTIGPANASGRLRPLNWPPASDGSLADGFQSSLSTVGVSWTRPQQQVRSAYPQAVWGLEQFHLGSWSAVERPRPVATGADTRLHVTNLRLHDGGRYRSTLRLCRRSVCTNTERTPPFVVLHSPPAAANISVRVLDDNSSLLLQMEKFQQLSAPAADAISHCQWTVIHNAAPILNWTNLTASSVPGTDLQTATLRLPGRLLFTKCLSLCVRCVNKVSLSASGCRRLKDCEAYDPKLIAAPTVVDAVGPVRPRKHAPWPQADVDYLGEGARASALWPRLRHGRYEWGLLRARGTAAATYFDSAMLEPPDSPASHPDAVAGGVVADEFVNAPPAALRHGARYHFCVRANATRLRFENFVQDLPQLSACSDGFTVVKEPLRRGSVSINGDFSAQFVTSLTEIRIGWVGFEPQAQAELPHATHVRSFEICLGTFANGCDIKPFASVQDSHQVVMTGMQTILQEGHVYFVTVRATNFLGVSATSLPRSFRVVLRGPLVDAQSGIAVGRRNVISGSGRRTVCWHGKFSDAVAGVRRYWFGLGTSPTHDDTVAFTESESECGVFTQQQLAGVKQGQHYHVIVKAENHAGLVTVASSAPALADFTAPVCGSVLDIDPSVSNSSDVNYRTDASGLSASWSQFHDPHSHVIGYWAAIGSCRLCEDVMSPVFVGVRQTVTVGHLQLQTGVRYFFSVRGCNAADLCATASSDGVVVDISRPVLGAIVVGDADTSAEFLPPQTPLSFSLLGFSDPESDIAFHRWAVAEWNDTASHRLKWTKISADTELVRTAELPPQSRWLRILVETTNRAGLSDTAESPIFFVDPTPPRILRPLSNAGTPGVVNENFTVARDTLTVTWRVEDEQSGIAAHWISLVSHDTAREAAQPQKVAGLLSSFTFSDLSLKDGAAYDVAVVSCNRARLCVRQAAAVTADTSPPTVGHFAARTDSSVDLGRHTTGGMRWVGNRVSLAWVGFQDPHSGIDRYVVEVDSSFLGSQLLQVEEVQHSSRGAGTPKDSSEGPIQLAELQLRRSLSAGDRVFVHLSAVNGAGLPSHPLHAVLVAQAGGSLLLVRRCDASTCSGHCACAPLHRRCRPTGDCRPLLPLDNPDHMLQVLDVLSPRSIVDLRVTPSRSLLAGRWLVSKKVGRPPLRFEFSAGLAEFDEPKGIFDQVGERVWYDAGRRDFAVVNLTAARSLQAFRSYKFFVRAWYDERTYVTFQSDGVVVNPRPPQVNSQLGVGVKDLLTPDSRRDTDFVPSRCCVTVGWRNKFRSAAGRLSFRVAVGSDAGMDDVAHVDGLRDVAVATFSHLRLRPGKRYFSCVTALHESGLAVTVSSDGFVVDVDKPQAGHVFSGLHFSDAAFTRNTTSLSASWLGFFDRGSFIKSYDVCVGSGASDGECDVAGWRSNSFRQSVELRGSWRQSATFFCRVRAVDAAGHKSAVVSSRGVTVDATPAAGRRRLVAGKNLARNPSFEANAEAVANASSLRHADLAELRATPEFWRLRHGRAAAAKVGHALAADGAAVLLLFGSVAHAVATEPGQKYQLAFQAAHLPVTDRLSATIDGAVSAPGLHQVFHLSSEIADSDRVRMHWHRHSFTFTATATVTDLQIQSLTHQSGLAVDAVSVRRLQLDDSDDSDDSGVSVHASAQPLRDFGSVQASWDIEDPESGISTFLWAIGTVPGGTQLQEFANVGTESEARAAPGRRLLHNSTVHVSVLAVNGAGVGRLFRAAPQLVDLTPPVIDFVFDGDSPDGHTRFQPSAEELRVQFAAGDKESGIGECRWCSGTAPGHCDVADFLLLPPSTFAAARRVQNHQRLSGASVFSTVRCTNGVGLSATAVSAGVRIFNGSPDASAAAVAVRATVVSPFASAASAVGNSSDIQLRWHGFQDAVGIAGFQVSVKDVTDGSVICDWTSVETATVQHLRLSGLRLRSGHRHAAAVRASNLIGKRSSAVVAEFLVDAEPPTLTGRQWRVTFDSSSRSLSVDWTSVFAAASDLVFEVTVETQRGAGDIQKWLSTASTSLRVKSVDPSQRRLFMRLTAVGASGLAKSVYGELAPS